MHSAANSGIGKTLFFHLEWPHSFSCKRNSHMKIIFQSSAAAAINSLEGRLKFGLREFSLVMFVSVLTPFLFPLCRKSNLILQSDNQKSVMTSKTVPSITTKEIPFIEFHSPHNEEK